MLYFVILFSVVWIVGCTIAFANFRRHQLALALVVPLALLFGFFGLTISSLPMLVLTLGTPVVLGLSCWRNPAVRVRTSVALMSGLCLFGLSLGGLYVPDDLERVKQLQAKLPLEASIDRLPPPSPYVLTSVPVKTFDRSPQPGNDRRVSGLKALHSDMVHHFINAPGFGENRLWLIQVFAESQRPLPDRTVIPLEPSPGRYQLFEGLSEARLKQFHEQGVRDFVNPDGYGWVKDQQAVAGFQEHQFSQWPELSSEILGDSTRDQWNIIKFQLVSLLKHDPPMAYESAHLPRMDELNHASVRPLTPFEEEGLRSLHSGTSPVVFVAADKKMVRMLGAIRARSDCRSCHQVPEGALLGAFSYEMLEVKSKQYVPPRGALE